MEKKRPTYDLGSIKQAFSDPDDIDITRTALIGARSLGFGIEEMLGVVQAIEKRDFVKSMTSHADHTVWQDVYNVPWENMLLYIKFTAGRITGFKLLSFKEV
jgi:motility quorum-sensing regulator/GCU-specific mRNA interferase toxin